MQRDRDRHRTQRYRAVPTTSAISGTECATGHGRPAPAGAPELGLVHRPAPLDAPAFRERRGGRQARRGRRRRQTRCPCSQPSRRSDGAGSRATRVQAAAREPARALPPRPRDDRRNMALVAARAGDALRPLPGHRRAAPIIDAPLGAARVLSVWMPPSCRRHAVIKVRDILLAPCVPNGVESRMLYVHRKRPVCRPVTPGPEIKPCISRPARRRSSSCRCGERRHGSAMACAMHLLHWITVWTVLHATS